MEDTAVVEGARQMSRRDILKGAGLAGGIAAGTTAATAQETTTVDMTDGLVFDPDELTIAPGTTVVWDNVGDIGHSVTAYEDDIPEEAEYFASGGFDSESQARQAWPEGEVAGGGTYEHTFEVTGSYDYFCIPHEGVGMIASLQVEEGGGGDGGTVPGPVLPGGAKSLAVAATLGMLAILSITYFLIRYGGDYELPGEEDES